jgi:lipopolysaccharide export system protein LptC
MVGALILALSRAAIGLVETARVDPNLPDMIAQQGVLVRYDEVGIKRSELIASEVTHIPAQDTMLFTKPKLVQTEPGKPTITVIGVRGKSILKASQVWFYDVTELRRAPFGEQAELIVHGRDVKIDQATQEAQSDQFVVADMGPHHVEAVGFIANNAAQTLVFKSKVKMTYVPTARNALVGAGSSQ